jgi:hypothetical protein
VYLDSAAEARRVNAHLLAAHTHTNSVADNFWANRSKTMKLTLLQDRIAQAGVLIETSRSALALVHEAMFPLNDQPKGLPVLLNQFENGICAAEPWSLLPSCALVTLRSNWSF